MEEKQYQSGSQIGNYTVEDEIMFFSGQLLRASDTDGSQVYLQEISLPRSLPKDFKEMLLHMKHPHLAPVIQVLEESDRMILVHPPLKGNPLPLFMREEGPLEPEKALRFAQRLTYTMMDLTRISLPFYTTLDPRNIIIDNDCPYIIFYGDATYGHREPNNKWKMEPDEKWRSLLFYLLTGKQPSSVKDKKQELSKHKMPQSIHELALDSLIEKNSIYAILRRMDGLVNKKGISPSLPKMAKLPILAETTRKEKSWILIGATIMTAIFALGLILFLFSSSSSPSTGEVTSSELIQAASPKQGETRKGTSSEEGAFLYTKKEEIKGATSINVPLKLNDVTPVTIQLKGANESTTYGLRVDEMGGVELFRSGENVTYTMANSGESFVMQPNTEYQVELLFIPNGRLRASITETGKKTRWLATGPELPTGKFTLEAIGEKKETSLGKVRTEKIDHTQTKLQEWRLNHTWDLVSGVGLASAYSMNFYEHVMIQSSYKKIDNQPIIFRRSAGYRGDPLQLYIDTEKGKVYELIWSSEGDLIFSQIDGDEKKELVRQTIMWEWEPGLDTELKVLTEGTKIGIELAQGSNRGHIHPAFMEKINIKNVAIQSESELEIIKK
ncbi:hypothetical protein [Mechercharimyces sp. CAU 1602]|uniref:hypothetical protein n=1 Tax=Mechercharimyces sp. CAU 1602 TaxID=2973933 RepID=UPI002162FC0C|nr:hypothetical protein [Mechercharimyces sp. CAU 1602]MCS1350732.1 hypothetical protein [Mechercharimyces sp. CAU 1602]